MRYRAQEGVKLGDETFVPAIAFGPAMPEWKRHRVGTMEQEHEVQHHTQGDLLDAVLLWYASEVFRAHKLRADPAGTEAGVACEFERLAESDMVRRAELTGQQALLLGLLAEEGRTERLKLAACRLQGALTRAPNPAASDVAPEASQTPRRLDTFASPPSRRAIETQAAMKPRAQDGINAPPTDDEDRTPGAIPGLAAPGIDDTMPGELTIGCPTTIVWRTQDAIAASPTQGAIASQEAIGALPAECVIDAMHAREPIDVTTTCLVVAAPPAL